MTIRPTIRSRRRVALGASLLGLTLAAGVCQAQVEYEFILVDAFVPSYDLRETYLYDLSETGIACGNTSVSDPSPNGGTSITTGGFYWTIDGKTRISVLAPHGVNNNGYIVGSGRAIDITTGQTFTPPNLPGLPGAPQLLGVNDGRVAVGWEQTCSCSNSQGLQQVPYVWDPAVGARTVSVPNATGLSRINSSNITVGWIGGRASPDAFVYDLNANVYTRISTLFAPPPDGFTRKTTAEDINDGGVVTGSRLGDDLVTNYGYTWTYGSGAAPTLLPLPPSPAYRPDVRPKSINTQGVVVGSMLASDGYERAFIYDSSRGLRDLNTLTTPPAGFVMRVATRNNDNGWIVGWGQGGGGFSRSFALRPLTPACTADFNHSGGVSVQDIFDFLAAYFAGNSGADVNHSGGVSVQDIFDYLALYFAGCP